jgi:hypothetical protein
MGPDDGNGNIEPRCGLSDARLRAKQNAKRISAAIFISAEMAWGKFNLGARRESSAFLAGAYARGLTDFLAWTVQQRAVRLRS